LPKPINLVRPVLKQQSDNQKSPRNEDQSPPHRSSFTPKKKPFTYFERN